MLLIALVFFECVSVFFLCFSASSSKDKPKALKRDSIYNIDMLF